ncbi:unnamed protein product [Linum trigynum]|uniref:Uncharacterized protein n=1 Tax=Linum trigynum TaxID=586398 RepID=A0AAV2D0L1_9ROSI
MWSILTFMYNQIVLRNPMDIIHNPVHQRRVATGKERKQRQVMTSILEEIRTLITLSNQARSSSRACFVANGSIGVESDPLRRRRLSRDQLLLSNGRTQMGTVRSLSMACLTMVIHARTLCRKASIMMTLYAKTRSFLIRHRD